METKSEKEKRLVREAREKKLERVFVYHDYLDMLKLYAGLTWEQFLKIRKLRKENDKKLSANKTVPEIYLYTSYGIQIKKPSYINDIDFKEYIKRLNYEYYELQKFDTTILLFTYKNRHRWYYSIIDFDGREYLCESFKHVLDTREHITIGKKKIIIPGKKDRNHGRKNLHK